MSVNLEFSDLESKFIDQLVETLATIDLNRKPV